MDERAVAAEVLIDEPKSAAPAPKANRVQIAVVAAIFIIFAVLSHYSASTPSAKGLGAALSLGPVLLIGVFFAWRWIRPIPAIVITVSICAGLYRYWPVVKTHYEWADLVQQSSVYAFLGLGFMRSLGASRVPLCTQLAEKMHGRLTPVEITYTRHASLAWGVFYALMTAAIITLFFTAGLEVWSFFVNFVTFGLILLMGIADHMIRRRLLPRHSGGGMLTIIQRAISG